MARQVKQRSGLKKFGGILLIIIIIIVIGIFAIKFSKPYVTRKFNETNTSLITVQQNITEEYTTIVKPGKANFWDALIWIFTALCITVPLLFFGYWFFKFLQGRRSLTSKNWGVCVKAALKRLRQKYPIDFEEPLTSERFFGGGDEKNLGWGLVFCRAGTDYSKPLNNISKYNLISCFVDAKTLDVMGEDHCRDLTDLEEHLRLQRLGKKADPYFPVKVEREPPLFGEYSGETKVSATTTLEAEEGEE